MAWDVLSRVTKTTQDVLSGVANLCGMFCPGVKKWHGMFCPGMFCSAPVSSDRMVNSVSPEKNTYMANSVKNDQTASEGAIWAWFTLYTKTFLPEYLG